MNMIFAFVDVQHANKKLCNIIDYPYLAWMYSFYDRFMIDFFSSQYHQYVVQYDEYVYTSTLNTYMNM